MRDFSGLAQSLKEKAGQRNRALAETLHNARQESRRLGTIRDLLRERKTVEIVSAPQLFCTPDWLCRDMVERAGIEAGISVLEPSAGTGNIADAIFSLTGIRPDCCEINLKLQGVLRSKEFSIVAGDFLECTARYDRILMNPPFVNQQDVDQSPIMRIQYAVSSFWLFVLTVMIWWQLWVAMNGRDKVRLCICLVLCCVISTFSLLFFVFKVWLRM